MTRPSRPVITRTVWLLSVVSLLTDVSSELLYPVMPVFLKSIGFSFFLIGLLEGVAEAVAGLSKGYFGNLSDRLGFRMPFVRMGYALSAAAKGLLALFATPVPVFLARLSDRLGKGVRTSSRDAMLALESTPATRARVFGLHRAMDTLGAAIGPLLALAYLYYHPGRYQALFAVAFMPGLAAVAVTFLVRERRSAGGKGKPGFFSFFGYWARALPAYRGVVGALTVFALVNSSDVFLLLAVKSKGFSDTQMIGVYVFYNLVFAGLAYPAGRLADRLGPRRIIVTGLLVFAAVYFLAGWIGSLAFFAGLFVAYAVYAACFESTAKAMVAHLCVREESGTALGLYNSLSSLAAIVASTWTGLVWMTLGPKWAFMISAAGALGAGLWLAMGKKVRLNPVQ